MKNDSVDHVMSSGNVFADLGLADSEDLLAKAELARQIASIISHRHLTQAAAAHLLVTTQPKVSDLLRGRLAGFSIERLIRFLNCLDRDVHILVSPKSRTHRRGRLSVKSNAHGPERTASATDTPLVAPQAGA